MNLLLVFVDSGDTESCAKRLSITLPEGQDVCVISLQQGVRNAEALHSK
jgi:ketopantoate reductase